MKLAFAILISSCLSAFAAHPSQLQGVQYSMQRVRGAILLIDAGDPTTLTFDATGTNVIQINDLSGFGNNLVSSNGTAQVPIQLPGVNGRTCLYFGLTSTCMTRTNFAMQSYYTGFLSGSMSVHPWAELSTNVASNPGFGFFGVGEYVNRGSLYQFTTPTWPTNWLNSVNTYDSSGGAIYYDGVLQSGTPVGSLQSNTITTNTLFFGARNYTGGGTAVGYTTKFAIYTNSVSSNDAAYLGLCEDRLIGKQGVPVFLSCAGDSITVGNQSSGGVRRYVNQIMGYVPSRWIMTNYGVTGETIPQMATKQATNGDISVTNYLRSISLSSIGVNDANGGTNGPTMYTNLINFYQQERAAGFSKVVGCTLYELNQSSTANSNVLVCNALLRSNAATYLDLLVDLAAEPRLTNNQDETYYSTDHLHPNNNGHSVLAQVIGRALATLGL